MLIYNFVSLFRLFHLCPYTASIPRSLTWLNMLGCTILKFFIQLIKSGEGMLNEKEHQFMRKSGIGNVSQPVGRSVLPIFGERYRKSLHAIAAIAAPLTLASMLGVSQSACDSQCSYSLNPCNPISYTMVLDHNNKYEQNNDNGVFNGDVRISADIKFENSAIICDKAYITLSAVFSDQPPYCRENSGDSYVVPYIVPQSSKTDPPRKEMVLGRGLLVDGSSMAFSFNDRTYTVTLKDINCNLISLDIVAECH